MSEAAKGGHLVSRQNPWSYDRWRVRRGKMQHHPESPGMPTSLLAVAGLATAITNIRTRREGLRDSAALLRPLVGVLAEDGLELIPSRAKVRITSSVISALLIGLLKYSSLLRCASAHAARPGARIRFDLERSRPLTSFSVTVSV